MQHVSFLTLAFVGFSFSVMSTLFIQRDTGNQLNHYDFSVPEITITDNLSGSPDIETEFLDIRCASSEYCLNTLVGNNAVLDGGAKLRTESVNARDNRLFDTASLQLNSLN